MGFSRSAPPSAVAPCASGAKDAKAKDDALIAGSRERAQVIGQRPQTPPGPCEQQARQVPAVADRMERYAKALPGARAARDFDALDDAASGPIGQPDMDRLPLNAADMNKALGIDPQSPSAITGKDLRNDATGHRSALYRDKASGQLLLASRAMQPDVPADWKTGIDGGQARVSDQYKAMRKLGGKLAQHAISAVAAAAGDLRAMEEQLAADRDFLTDFRAHCG